MSVLKNLLFLLVFSSSLFASEMVNGKMGILTDGITHASDRDYGIIFNLLLEKLSAQENIKSHLSYYNKASFIIKDFRNHELDYMAINPIFYLQNQEVLDPLTSYFWSVRKYNEKFQKIIIVVRKGDAVSSISDLKDKKVLIKKNNYIGELVLDKAILEKAQVPSRYYIKKLEHVKSDLAAVLKVYFHQGDVALISENAFDLISEMNPAIKKNLVSIYHTENLFMPIISLVHIKTSPQLLPKMKNILKHIHLSREGKNVFDFIKMQEIDILDKKELIPLKNYYNEYLILQEKYGKFDEKR